MYCQEGDRLETSAGRENRLARERAKNTARQEQVRLQREKEEKAIAEQAKIDASKTAEKAAAELLKRTEYDAANFLLAYNPGQELEVERKALQNMLFFSDLLRRTGNEFTVKDKRLSRADVAHQFSSWKEERKRLLTTEVKRLSEARVQAEQGAAQASKEAAEQRERHERTQLVASLAKQGRYGNANVEVLDVDTTLMNDKEQKYRSLALSIAQREIEAKQRLSLY